MVEENGTSGGNGDPLANSPPHPIAVTNVREATIVTYNTQPQKVRICNVVKILSFQRINVLYLKYHKSIKYFYKA